MENRFYKKPEFWMRLGAVYALLAVAIGAFGAHALKNHFAAAPNGHYLEEVFRRGSQYHFYHSLGLVAWALSLRGKIPSQIRCLVGVCFSLGTLLFSGSLYIIAITDWHALGMITPIGGTLFLIGWGIFARSSLSSS